MSITITFHVCQTFWFISLLTLHDNDRKFSDRSGRRTQKTSSNLKLSFAEPETFDNPKCLGYL